MANKCVLTCQDIDWHTILSLQLAWHAPISVELTRLCQQFEFFSQQLDVQRDIEGLFSLVRIYGLGSPKCCFQVPNGERILHRGAQQKIRGNNHKEQQGKFWLKKSDKEKKCSKEQWFSTGGGAQRHGGMKPDLEKHGAPQSDFDVGPALSWRLDQLVLSSPNYPSHGRLKAQCSHCVVKQQMWAPSASLGCCGRAGLDCPSRQHQPTGHHSRCRCTNTVNWCSVARKAALGQNHM